MKQTAYNTVALFIKLYRNITKHFSGYGNKPTDVTAYKEVGIPTSHIFIVNKIGNLKHQVCESVSTSYKEQGQMVDHYFPAVRTLRPASKNQFLYWRDPVPSVDLANIH